MADLPPDPIDNDPLDNVPLGERLRATFAAEHAEVERRHNEQIRQTTKRRAVPWIPFAAAAAVIAIVGLFFISTRGTSSDQVVDVGVATQPTETPQTPALSASPTPQPATSEPAPTSTSPVVAPAANECGITIERVAHFVWDIPADDPDGGLVAHTGAGVDEPVTRIIGPNEVVRPTGGCVRTANGSAWYQLEAPDGSFEWANERYLRETEVACLADSLALPIFHLIAPGDRLGAIAGRYNVELDEVLRANPDLDRDYIRAGWKLLIPSSEVEGPRDGIAFEDPDEGPTAFAMDGDTNYRPFASEAVTVGATCSQVTAQGSPLDSLAGLPCVRTAVTPLQEVDGPRVLTVGDAESLADHVHDMTAESNGECTRLVVTFGENANAEDGSDQATRVLPPIEVMVGREAITIRPDGWALQSSFQDTQRVDYDGGVGLLTLSAGYEFSVQFLHREMQPHVRLLSDPARIVIDLFPVADPSPWSTQPFGERFVLRQPIQRDQNGPGIPEQNGIVVAGFGRPFEAAGLYRIWSVPDGTDPDVFLADPPEPLIEDFFPTAGWAEAWGEFFVDLPDLAPGTYIAVFGELPPTDEIGFYGTGQLFRVADPSAPTDALYPEAVLLPDVQLPPES